MLAAGLNAVRHPVSFHQGCLGARRTLASETLRWFPSVPGHDTVTENAPQAHGGRLPEAILVGRRSRTHIGLDPRRPRVLPIFRDALIAALAQRRFHGGGGEPTLGEERAAAVLVGDGGVVERAAEKLEQRRAHERQDDERDEDFEQREAA